MFNILNNGDVLITVTLLIIAELAHFRQLFGDFFDDILSEIVVHIRLFFYLLAFSSKSTIYKEGSFLHRNDRAFDMRNNTVNECPVRFRFMYDKYPASRNTAELLGSQ